MPVPDILAERSETPLLVIVCVPLPEKSIDRVDNVSPVPDNQSP
jgi:hypothetical protein